MSAKRPASGRSHRVPILFAAIALLGAQWLLTLLLPASRASGLRFWGGNAFRFLPGYFGVLLLVLTLLGIVWIWRRHDAPAPPAARALPDRTRSFRLLGPALVLLSLAVFWLLRSRYALLGDNWLRVQQAQQGEASQFETGIMGLYSILGRLLTRIGLGNTHDAFVLVSLAAGLVYAGTAWMMARRFAAGGPGVLLGFAGLLSCGTVEIFCGYVEVYPLILALLFLVTLTALQALEGKAPPYLPVMLLALTILLHRLAVLWIPAALTPLWFRARVPAARTLKLCLGATLLTGTAAAAIMGGRSSVLLPLLPSPGREYAVLSIPHLSDFVNAQFLGSVAAFLLAPPHLFRFLRADHVSPERALCLFAWLLPAAGLFFFRPLLGGADWDLLSLAAPFGVLFVIASAGDSVPDLRSVTGLEPAAASQRRSGAFSGSTALAGPVLALAVLLSTWNTIPWLCLQRSEASLAWVRALLETDRADYFQGHPAPLHLAALFASNGLFDRQREELLRGADEYPDDPRFPFNLAVYAVNRGRWDEVERYALQAYRTKRDYVPALEILYEADKALKKPEDQAIVGHVLLDLHRAQPGLVERYLPRERVEKIRREVEALPAP